MKLILVRHGDPDYTLDSLTEKGWHEAEILAERISTFDVDDFYCSPLGRARDTAYCTLKKISFFGMFIADSVFELFLLGSS